MPRAVSVSRSSSLGKEAVDGLVGEVAARQVVVRRRMPGDGALTGIAGGVESMSRVPMGSDGGRVGDGHDGRRDRGRLGGSRACLSSSWPTSLAAELAATEAVAAVLHRDRTGEGSFREVALSGAAETMAAPLQHGMTGPQGVLGGTLPADRSYAPADAARLACATLEPHFFSRLTQLLGVSGSSENLEAAFKERTPRD